MKTKIRLANHVWEYDENDALGPAGGFGEVFRGQGNCGEVAVKRLMLTADAAAHRELKLGKSLSSRTLKNVVPILDYGQDAESDRYYLIMPVCDYSLEAFMQTNGLLEWSEAQKITADIIDGLLEVGDIVHRDLKPGNILWHDDKWKIADFGIAKFVEDSTSPNTLKTSLSEHYAAPEQWLLQSSTVTTDVYALACIIHKMISGVPPFTGDSDTVRDGHLKGTANELSGLSLRINGLIRNMLRKPQAARPSLERCKEVISQAQTSNASTSLNALEVASLQVATKQAEDEAERLREQEQIKLVRQQGNEAKSELLILLNSILDKIADSSEVAKRSNPNFLNISLGPAALSFPDIDHPSCVNLSNSGWRVLAFSSVQLHCQIVRVNRADESEYTFSASLVYAKQPNTNDYRWFEISFWSMRGNFWRQPISLSPNDRDFDIALSNTMGTYSKAFGPVPINAEDAESFSNRWIGLFAKAAQGKLRPPREMPPPATFYTDP